MKKLKYVIYFALAVFILIGCDGKKLKTKKVHNTQYKTILIDGCEYIEVKFLLGMQNGYYSLTHKGDCNNPKHNCN